MIDLSRVLQRTTEVNWSGRRPKEGYNSWEETVAFAIRQGRIENFLQQFTILANMTLVAGELHGKIEMRMTIGPDFAPYSFSWALAQRKLIDGRWTEWQYALSGGLIYHSSSNDWSLHT